MDNLMIFLVVFGTLGFLVAIGFIFLRGSKRNLHEPSTDVNEFEERVLDLIGRFQHISANRLSALESRIMEMQKILRESNEVYLQLSSLISESSKFRSELDKQINSIAPVPHSLTETSKEEEETIPDDLQRLKEKVSQQFDPMKVQVNEVPQETEIERKKATSPQRQFNSKTEEEAFERKMDVFQSSLEHRILNLSSEGLDPEEIAKQLEIGKGEVILVLELFRRKSG